MKSRKLFSFSKHLLNWYDQQGRKNLPWRDDITPYRVWISEIMLQQTQVQTVIPYFQRFITRFPTVIDLAKASEDEVLHLWTGLGYYARARNLHRAAKTIQTQHKGTFPNTLEELQSLPGIGRSTAGAILAIAFNQKATILDGNVKRVLTRFHAIEGVTSQAQVSEQLWVVAEQHTPEKRTADYTQAIMDLGATICLRTKPLCKVCPMTKGCEAFVQNRQQEFPTPKPSKKTPLRTTHLLIFHDAKKHQVLLEKRPPVGIWGGLWSFPECPLETDVVQWCSKNLNIDIIQMQTLPTFRHVFTHFKLNITPIHISRYQHQNVVRDTEQTIWYSLINPSTIGLSQPVKKLISFLQQLT